MYCKLSFYFKVCYVRHFSSLYMMNFELMLHYLFLLVFPPPRDKIPASATAKEPYGGVEFNVNSTQESLIDKEESTRDSNTPYGKENVS